VTTIQLPATSILLAYVDILTDIFKIAYTLLLPDGTVAESCSFRDFVVVDESNDYAWFIYNFWATRTNAW